MSKEKTGLIIWRNSFDDSVHYYDETTKDFNHASLGPTRKRHHTLEDLEEATKLAKTIMQTGNIYFLDDATNLEKAAGLYENYNKRWEEFDKLQKEGKIK